jgi:hypothetical protein
MIMVSTFLPVVFNNLPPIVRSHHIWTIIWILSLIVFYPKIFLNRAIIYVVGYGLFIFIASNLLWNTIDEWNYNLLFSELYQVIIGLSVITYFYESKDYLSLAKITQWSIVFIFITAIMSIISSAIDPMYARNLVGVSSFSDESEREAILNFKRYGGGSYSMAAAFMCLFPILIYYYKNIKLSIVSKMIILIISIAIFVALLGMQIFGNIIIALLFGTIALLGMKRIKQSILIIGLFFSILVVTPKEIYINSLLSISNYFEKQKDLNYKLKDLAIFIQTGGEIRKNSSGTAARAERYPMLLETFIKSPLLGCYAFADVSRRGYTGEGAHLYWMNKLTVTGILGFMFFLFIPYNFIKNRLLIFDSNYKFYYLLAALSILSYGLMKALAGRETWYTFFILLPGLYYLPLLKKKQ